MHINTFIRWNLALKLGGDLMDTISQDYIGVGGLSMHVLSTFALHALKLQ